MATTPIVTEVTLEELDALVAANALSEGLQYRVLDTNIDWLLVADSFNTLVSMSGELVLFNGVILPSYIETKILLLDTGTVTEDIESSPLELTVPNGYLFTSLLILSGVSLTSFSVVDSDSGQVAGDDISSGDFYGIRKAENNGLLEYNFQVSQITASGNQSPGFRATLKFEKSYFI